MPGWSDQDGILTRLLSADPLTILIAFVVAFGLPILLHQYLYQTRKAGSVLPQFLLLGPSGAGKTSFFSLLEYRNSHPPPTQSSQTTTTANLELPGTITPHSSRYRSANDTLAGKPTPYTLIDTPGHGKLRPSHAMPLLTGEGSDATASSTAASKKNKKKTLGPVYAGIIFMIDGAALTASAAAASTLTDSAAYLHDVLLYLQRRETHHSGSKRPKQIPVCIAVNKQDLFTSLPAASAKAKLEKEIEVIRRARKAGVGAVDGVAADDAFEDEELEMLGGDDIKEGVAESFSFKRLEEEYGVVVEAVGGSVKGEDAPEGDDGVLNAGKEKAVEDDLKRVRRWEEWIGSCL